MKEQLSVRLPEDLRKRMEDICLKEGERSANSFIVEAVSELVNKKENSKDGKE